MQSTRAASPSTLDVAMAHTLGDLVDSIAALDRMQAALAARKAELVDQARQWSEVTETSTAQPHGWSPAVRARKVLVSELACALRIPERTAEKLVAQSQALVHDLPLTLAALGAGEITWRHAVVMVDHAGSIDTEFAAGFEASALPRAKALTVAQFDRAARIQRERMHPESIESRHATASEARSLDLQPARDGMAWLSAYLPAVVAHGIYNRVTDVALKQQSPAEERTLTQLRADVFAELLLDGVRRTDADAGIRPRVLVTVPALTLLGRSDEPAVLEGYGPIDLATALELAANAPSFTRLLTHPETGAVLSVGRNSYAVPADLRTWLRVRDGTCRFPGCSRAARTCDVDHTDDWQFGSGTDHDNLAHLCPMHHNLKHQTGWALRQLDDGTLEWTSPSGRVYTTQAATTMRPGHSTSA